MLRIGIDVGGTHTDAVLMDGDEVAVATKALTTSDVLSGILNALESLLGEAEKMISYVKVARDTAIRATTAEARQFAIEAGADAGSLRTADIEETTISYMGGDTTRVRVKVVGDIAGLT